MGDLDTRSILDTGESQACLLSRYPAQRVGCQSRQTRVSSTGHGTVAGAMLVQLTRRVLREPRRNLFSYVFYPLDSPSSGDMRFVFACIHRASRHLIMRRCKCHPDNPALLSCLAGDLEVKIQQRKRLRLLRGGREFQRVRALAQRGFLQNEFQPVVAEPAGGQGLAVQ